MLHLRPTIGSRAHTAVLLFARTAAAESRTKTYAASPRLNLSVCAALERRALRTITASGLPLVRCSEVEQSGTGFGQRLATAVAATLALGYAHVIVVGADCPQLSSADLRRTAATLAAGRQVVGRDRRGGAYLVGISAGDFDPVDFANLPWCTRELAGALLAALPGVSTLRTLTDLNARGDVRAAWSWLRGLPELEVLGLVVAHVVRVWRAAAAFAKACVRGPRANRGPPVVA